VAHVGVPLGRGEQLALAPAPGGCRSDLADRPRVFVFVRVRPAERRAAA
jgi:hypothetical protein